MVRVGAVAALLSVAVASDAPSSQPFFPVFHIRPPAGHVNDPNGPFRDPRTGYMHLFMQYCPRGPCDGQGAVPARKPRNYQSATHFYSKDGGATWAWTGNASGVVANCDPLIDASKSCKCKPKPGGVGNTCESASDCPDDLGVYSGSTTIVNGVPYYAYPGVHHYTYGNSTAVPTMSQCFATPADPADKTLKAWKKHTFIPQAQIPHGISQHFHDDSSMFKANGRWWIFMGSAECGGKPTGDCPHPAPNAPSGKGKGVNFLFSSADGPGVAGATWRAEHSLVNTSGFVSCPEFFTLPDMKKNVYVYHAMGAKNSIGTFDEHKMLFTPDARSQGKYDNGDGHACKSYWDTKTSRRIMWCWISGVFPCQNPQGFECDSMQSVPQTVQYSGPELDTLIVNPIQEIEQLRTGLKANQSFFVLPPTPTSVRGANDATLDITANFSCTGSSRASCGGALQVRGDQSDPRKGGLTVAFKCSQAAGCDFALCKSTNCTVEQLHMKSRVHVPFSKAAPFAGEFNMRVLVDTSVVEVYAMSGRAISTILYVPKQHANTAVRVSSNCDPSSSVNAVVTVYGMGSAYS